MEYILGPLFAWFCFHWILKGVRALDRSEKPAIRNTIDALGAASIASLAKDFLKKK